MLTSMFVWITSPVMRMTRLISFSASVLSNVTLSRNAFTITYDISCPGPFSSGASCSSGCDCSVACRVVPVSASAGVPQSGICVCGVLVSSSHALRIACAIADICSLVMGDIAVPASQQHMTAGFMLVTMEYVVLAGKVKFLFLELAGSI